MSKKRRGMFVNDDQRKAIFASINKEPGLSKTKVAPFGLTQNTDIRGIFKNVNKVGQEQKKIKAGGGMAIKIDTPKVKKSSLEKFDPKLDYGKTEKKYNKMVLNEKTSFKLNEPGVYSAHLEEVKSTPEVTISGRNLTVFTEDDEEVTTLAVETHDKIKSAKPESIGPNIVATNIVEEDGGQTNILVAKELSSREKQRRIFQDETKKNLEKIYSSLTKEKPSKSWSRNEVVEAIIDERYDEKGRVKKREIQSKITQTKNRKPEFTRSRPKSKMYESKKKVASMSQIEAEMIKRKLPLTQDNIWNVVEDKYDMDDFKIYHTTVAAYLDMVDAGHKPNNVMKKEK